MALVTAGRTDVDAYFEKSGIRESKKLNHTPFLVFVENGDTVEVKIVDNAAILLTYPPGLEMQQCWPNQGRGSRQGRQPSAG